MPRQRRRTVRERSLLKITDDDREFPRGTALLRSAALSLVPRAIIPNRNGARSRMRLTHLSGSKRRASTSCARWSPRLKTR